MEGPLFSIVVPTYNRPETLKEAIESALAQEVRDFELIVVNDGGLKPKVPKDRRLRVINRANGGVSAARNSGITCARGKYVTFLDDDDLFAPGRLDVALEGLQGAEIAVCSKSFGVTASSDIKNFMHGSGLHVGQFALALSRCPRFDERLRQSEDLDWAIRVLQSRCAIIDKPGYIMRDHRGPRLTARTEELVANRALLLDIHRDYFSSRRDIVQYQWNSLGVMARERQEWSLARKAFARSLAVQPSMKALIRWGEVRLWEFANEIRRKADG